MQLFFENVWNVSGYIIYYKAEYNYETNSLSA